MGGDPEIFCPNRCACLFKLCPDGSIILRGKKNSANDLCCGYYIDKEATLGKRIMEVAIRELKNNLSKYLRHLEKDNEIIITKRGKPVAIILSKETKNDKEAGVIERLRSLPWIRHGKGGKPKGASRPVRLKPGDRLLSDLILEDRE
jgi:prevent-host-death family protein